MRYRWNLLHAQASVKRRTLPFTDALLIVNDNGATGLRSCNQVLSSVPIMIASFIRWIEQDQMQDRLT